jgi:excisionase family DNA binding protein
LTKERESPTPPTDSEAAQPESLFRPPETDTYGTTEVAQLLSISPSRVRQLVARGDLSGQRDAAGRLRISKETVHTEHMRRLQRKPTAPRTTERTSGEAQVEPNQVADVLERTVRAAIMLRDELVQERVRRHQAEITLQTAETRMAALEALEAEARAARAERIAALERSLDDVRLALRALGSSELPGPEPLSDPPVEKPLEPELPQPRHR